MLIFELVVSGIFLAISLGICGLSWNIPLALAPSFWVSAGCFPFALGTILLLLSMWWIAELATKIIREKKSPSPVAHKPWLDELFGNKEQKKHLLVITISTLIFVFVLIPLLGKMSREYGFILASFIFLCVTIKVFTGMKVWKVILISVVTVASIYVVFHFGLNVLMPV